MRLPVVRLRTALPVVRADGSRSDRSAYELARDRMMSAPLELTQKDFDALAAVDPSLATQARQYRELAERDRARTQTKSVGPSPAPSHKNGLPESLATEIVHVIKAALAPIQERLADAEQELKTLKAQPQLKYCGVWREHETFSEGSLCTKGGGLWLATGPRLGTPGTPGSGWRLIVKAGTAVDARDPVVVVRAEGVRR
jgi:hypothetical protein